MAQARRRRIEDELKGLFGFALALSGDRGQAEELVQETVLQALSARQVPDSAGAFRAWLFRQLRSAAGEARRASRHMTPTEPEKLAERIDGTQSLAAAGDALADVLTLRAALARLKPAQREIVALVDIAGFRYAEVAELLGVPVGTVMSRVCRARAALAQEVAGSVAERVAGTNVLPLAAARAGRGG
ncbi:RNA polymerase sigma-70 factor, ECF subfamily [Tistlia consotensis]|uniref:RNA polymerase sigma-70 factor, ECF subfamily n=1 Tax=Tistlia consotensis USBA 355 TaxID=560819 RepID=A0A1Y6CU61_9PROT|nr:sigma-70 family RNA polymerase sigma factor [Tistlia consotensis]SMF78232.1 RNA polymerase sigma-70 factor, ECF subfamily [Tistlia consotensis USBA 355]SNS18110.1 RNA polymerase sigma-70 factor, ECF subfamily [Tistlia consotensis]